MNHICNDIIKMAAHPLVLWRHHSLDEVTEPGVMLLVAMVMRAASPGQTETLRSEHSVLLSVHGVRKRLY